MANSIKDILGASDTISEIRLLLGNNKNNVCVVVEGINDLKLFEPLLARNTTLVQSYSGKKDIISIIKYFPRNKRVIGIRDRDYSKRTESKRIFFYDYCCAEMMIISLDECFDRIYSNFYRGTSFVNGTELRLYCLQHLEKFSKMRQFNEQKGKRIRFKGISMANVYDDNLAVMNSKIISELKKRNTNINKIQEINKIIAKCDAMIPCGKLTDYFNITNGHDF